MSINFGSQYTQILYRWDTWKTNAYSVKNFMAQYHEDNEYYTIYGYDGPDVHVCQIFRGEIPYSTAASYSQEQNDNDLSDFETNYKSNFNKPIERKQLENKAWLVAQVGREGNETIYATHNFCDPTTWFGDSVRVSEVLSGSGTVFSGSYTNWIDLKHGKVFDEEGYREDVTHGYDIIVVANNVTMSMRTPFASSGGDYVVNYASGTIEFVNEQTYNVNEITASYSFENGSGFYIVPSPYKKMDVEEVEAQFTRDVVINDTICFSIFGYVQVFAPQYWEGNGGPFPTNYRILIKSQKYQSLMQIIDEALGSYPIIPAIGGQNGRGLKSDMFGFPFRYGTVRTLYDSYGLQIKVHNENDEPHSGDRVTATFYCVSSNEA